MRSASLGVWFCHARKELYNMKNKCVSWAGQQILENMRLYQR